jgi:hypothetical protein
MTSDNQCLKEQRRYRRVARFLFPHFGIAIIGIFFAGCLRFMVFLSACLVLLNGASAAETRYDIFPLSWVNHNGDFPSFPNRDLDALVMLPAPVTEAGINESLHGFLARGNGIKKGEFTFFAHGSKGTINFLRYSQKSLDLDLEMSPKSLNLLRRLDWQGFRRVQADFEICLFESSPRCFLSWGSPRKRFSRVNYEPELRRFWRECLAGSEFQTFADRFLRPIPRRHPMVDQMGVIPLVPGMRLSIHWGGTALYPYTSNENFVTRPTSAGVTVLDVVLREGSLHVGPKLDWSLFSRVPGSGQTETVINPPLPLPFGNNNQAFGGRVLPVLNDIDLWQLGGLSESTGINDRIALLIPWEYTKPDLARPDTTSTSPSIRFHHPSLAEKEKSTDLGQVAKGLSRNFLLWRYDASDGLYPPVPSFTPAAIDSWPPTLVFGNQTLVVPELSILLQGVSPIWVPVGTTWNDVARTYAPWLFSIQPDLWMTQPILRMRRAPLSIEAAFQPSGSLLAVDLRFWVLPPDGFSHVEAEPGDTLYFQR